MQKVLVFAHDAGGGEVIAAYLNAHAKKWKPIVYAAGPAERIFRRERIPVRHIRQLSDIRALVRRHADAVLLLAGARWYSRIESRAVSEAKKVGLKSAVYLDSWIHYRERFFYPTRGWQRNLPDELWVGDSAALAMAKRFFHARRVRLVRNEYFAAAIKRYQAARRRTKTRDILFVSDVSRDSIIALNIALRALRRDNGQLRIRLHPADDRKRYEALLKNAKGSIRVTISKEPDIAGDLAKAAVVMGPETAALAVSALCGLPTIRILSSGKKVMIPIPGIRTARNIAALRRML